MPLAVWGGRFIGRRSGTRRRRRRRVGGRGRFGGAASGGAGRLRHGRAGCSPVVVVPLAPVVVVVRARAVAGCSAGAARAVRHPAVGGRPVADGVCWGGAVEAVAVVQLAVAGVVPVVVDVACSGKAPAARVGWVVDAPGDARVGLGAAPAVAAVAVVGLAVPVWVDSSAVVVAPVAVAGAPLDGRAQGAQAGARALGGARPAACSGVARVAAFLGAVAVAVGSQAGWVVSSAGAAQRALRPLDVAGAARGV